MPSSSGLNSLFASSIRFNKFYHKDKQILGEYQPVSTTSLSSDNATTPSSGASTTSHRRSFSRSSQIDIPQAIRRSLSLKRSSLSGQTRSRPSSGVFSSPGRSSTPPSALSQSNTEGDSRGRPGTRSKAMVESSGGLQRSVSYGASALGAPAQIQSNGGPQSATLQYQQIVETATKRISTLDYLRKSHEGRVYWFNTLLYTKSELLKLPYFSPPKLARRAQNYLLLGFSLPMILDLNSQTPTEYLKALNALLTEFEQYQSMHPPDGTSSSLSRGRIPSMFKRATGGTTKSRRMTDSSSGPSGTGLEIHDAPPPMPSLPIATSAEPLLPTEQYTHLLTPPLPFDPDFFETFATLCDVLIDCYSRVTQLVNSPEICAPGTGVGELFTKADSRVRKIIVNGVVREFEERCRDGVKGEIAGVGRVILGGLI